MILNYDDFVRTVLEKGFTMGGGNSEGIYSVIPWNWNEEPPYETSVAWHTGDAKTDPWEWRMRVLEERNDIAYAKVFFKKSGFISKEWYPYFWVARRGNKSFEEMYFEGKLSHFAKRIYDVVEAHDALPSHEIKQIAGFVREDKSGFERALVELQMNMFLTMCGQQQKRSMKGGNYGMPSVIFCTTEKFWGEEMVEKVAEIDVDFAEEEIWEQVQKVNPAAQEKKIRKFIYG
ncbi:MAG: hypothetical protein FWE25_08080 [Lachnospiraceae bacterium]|nr:hypothetical protein [Lachnospiraceae bacterium]